MISSEFELSIVICTRNRANALKESLVHLSSMEQLYKWEIIFVDNGSTDETSEVLKRYCSKYYQNCKMLYEPQPGLSRARNKGWRSATAEFVAFTDDDCYPTSDFPTKIVQTFAKHPKLGFIGGQVLLWNLQDLPITIQTSSVPVEILAGSYLNPGLIHGANMAVRRRLLENEGGFDEILGVGGAIPAGEDIELLSAVCAGGHIGRYEPTICVYHHHGRRTMSDVKKLKIQYALGRGGYWMKCVLDHRRRVKTMKNIYWAWRVSFLDDSPNIPNIKFRWLEMRGALVYFLLRYSPVKTYSKK